MKQPHIVVIGSLNMDLVVSVPRMPQVGETLTGTGFKMIPGGKGANQAVGCTRLGAKTTLIGAVGCDAFGEQMIMQLKAEGIQTATIERIENVPTGTATIYHSPNDNCIAVVPGANEYCTPELVSSHERTICEADLLLVQLEIPPAAVNRAMEIAASAGVPVVLNPAPAQQLPEEMLKLASFITPNETEFELISGSSSAEADLQHGMLNWEERYGNQLIITRGKQGSSFLLDGALETVKAPLVEVVDTTGAGDAFNSAFCVAYAGGQSKEQAVSFAVKAASLSVTKFGAQAGMPTLQEVIEA